MTKRRLPIIDLPYQRYLGVRAQAQNTEPTEPRQPPWPVGFTFPKDNTQDFQPMRNARRTQAKTAKASPQDNARKLNDVRARVMALISARGAQPVEMLRAAYLAEHGRDIAADLKATADRFTHPETHALNLLIRWRQEAKR